MPRNRRDSTSVKFAVGRGCFLLVIGIVCVGFSVTKIIVGSEYVSSCPSREMIPVYVLVSGCLPVLLSALRQPYDGGHAMDKERCSMKISLVTAVVGVMVNLAWLVAGTYLVVSTWHGNICKTPISNEVTGTSLTETNNALVGKTTIGSDKKTSILLNTTESPTTVGLQQSDDITSQNNSRPHLKSENEIESFKIMDMMKNAKVISKIEATDNISNTGSPITVSTTEVFVKLFKTMSAKDVKNSVTIFHNNDNFTDNKIAKVNNNVTKDTENVNSGEKDSKASLNSVSEVPIGNIGIKSTVQSVDKFDVSAIKPEIVIYGNRRKEADAGSQERMCITCDIHILRFSLAVVVIDWVFVTIGVVYFCHFVYFRFASLKDQLLLIKA